MEVSPRRLVILGATGTVGSQALKLLAQSESPLQVVALSAHSQIQELQKKSALQPTAQQYLTQDTEQREALLKFLTAGEGYDLCLNAMVGAAGLPFSMAVVGSGRDLALANKESLVCAGELLMSVASSSGSRVLPVDSEHSAIAQCLMDSPRTEIRSLLLTGSGGGLRDLPLDELPQVTPEQALQHPNWDMGPRITVDSATMMNKALELIEAQVLFGVEPSAVQIVIHRQSIVHSMVEFIDGSVLAQLGPPNMAFPIHWALHAPGRSSSPLEGFSFKAFKTLEFSEPDERRYPALNLGRKAAEAGGSSGAILNAADEVAVEAFLQGRLSFDNIVPLCEATLTQCQSLPASTLSEVYAADHEARRFAQDQLSTLST